MPTPEQNPSRKVDDFPARLQARLMSCHIYLRRRGQAARIQWLLRAPLRIAGLLWFRVAIRGSLPDMPSIVIANHTGALDPVPLERIDRWSNRRPVVMAKAPLFRHAWLAWFFSRLGFFPVQRGHQDQQAQITAQQVLDSGGRMLIFPEGTWMPGDGVGQFRSGAARLSIHSQVPLVPVYVDGVHRGHHAWFPKRLGFKVQIGQPLWPDPDESPEELTGRARAALLNLREQCLGVGS